MENEAGNGPFFLKKTQYWQCCSASGFAWICSSYIDLHGAL